MYLIGSVYFGATSTSPVTLFGGTWVQIKDTLIGASGDTYGKVGNTGGDTKIRDYNLPEHTHNCIASAEYHYGDSVASSWAGFWFTDASKGNKWSLLAYGAVGEQDKWLYATSLSGVSGPKYSDYIPSHYNLTVWQRTQ